MSTVPTRILADVVSWGGSKIMIALKFRPRAGQAPHEFKTIDSHTMGEATRIVLRRFSRASGNTPMMEKQF